MIKPCKRFLHACLHGILCLLSDVSSISCLLLFSLTRKCSFRTSHYRFFCWRLNGCKEYQDADKEKKGAMNVWVEWKEFNSCRTKERKNSRRITVAFECGAAGLHLYKLYEQTKKQSKTTDYIFLGTKSTPLYLINRWIHRNYFKAIKWIYPCDNLLHN